MSDSRWTRREFLKAGAGLLAGAALHPFLPALPAGAEAGPGTEVTPPNVVYILSDELRTCSVGCYGSTEVSTPHIDGLSTESAFFSNAVATTPLCTPYRGCLMTGRYPTVTGVTDNNIKLPRGERCIAEVFRQNGYRTQYIGKWHLDGAEPDPVADPGWVEPLDRQGFQKWTAYNYAHVYYDSKYYLNNDPAIRTIPAGRYEPDWQAEQAMRFIAGSTTTPFFLLLSIGTPHPPSKSPGVPPGGDYVFPYDPDSLTLRPNVDFPDEEMLRRHLADYYGMISNLDWNVGRILDRLDGLGLADNTIVVVTSDHGDLLGSHYEEIGYWRAKACIYAEALDVPFLLRYPGQIAPQTMNRVFTTVDIMPTLLGLCGLPVPSGVMGRDFAPVLTGTGEPVDPPWGPVPSAESALVGYFSKDWVGVRRQEYSFRCHRTTLVPTHLYANLADPYQMANRVDDPSYQPVKDALYADLLAWLGYVDYS